MIQTHAEALIEEGIAKGRAEGEKMTQTHAEALMEEGALRTNRDTLRRLLLRRFQQLPDVVLQRIETCADNERLKAAIDRVLDMKSLDEFDL